MDSPDTSTAHTDVLADAASSSGLRRRLLGAGLIGLAGSLVPGLASRADRPDLPVIVGEGADEAAAEALELVDAAGPMMKRLRGLVRMGDRRWDMVLDRNQRLLLPEDRPVQALERLRKNLKH